MPIQNANTVKLNQNPGTLPDLSGALLNWFQKLQFNIVNKTTVNFQVVETLTPVETQGVRQPLSAQKLMIKPEGQRRWKWEMIHALPNTPLEPDMIIKFKDQNYRVMDKWDWTEYGYIEYHIVQDYDQPEDE